MNKDINKVIKKELYKLNYDNLFVKLAWPKYYGEPWPEEYGEGNLEELKILLKSMPKPTPISIKEDTRTEWGGVKLGEVVSAEDLPKIYDRMSEYADNSSNKFEGEYELKYIPVDKRIDKYMLADDYEDLEHFDRVNEYVKIIKSGEEFPPIIYTRRSMPSHIFFHDGAHRMAAHVELGRKKILAFYPPKK